MAWLSRAGTATASRREARDWRVPGPVWCLCFRSGESERATRCGNGPSFVHRQGYRGIASPVFSFRPIFNHPCGRPKDKRLEALLTRAITRATYIKGNISSGEAKAHNFICTPRPSRLSGRAASSSLRRGSRSVARNTGHLHRRAPGHGHPLTRVRRPNRCKPENCSKDRVPPSCLDNIANANANISMPQPITHQRPQVRWTKFPIGARGHRCRCLVSGRV